MSNSSSGPRVMPDVFETTITRLGAQGDGTAEGPGGPLHIPFALPGERVRAVREGKAVRLDAVLDASPDRVDPACAYFGRCGGCQLQHVERGAALTWRQQALDEQIRLTHALTDLPWVAPIRSSSDEYRRKTRLALDARKGKPLALGFRAQKSDKVVNISHCPVLEPALNALLPA